LDSEWVAAEWGAAWVLGKKIVPLLHCCDTSQIPLCLRDLPCIDMAKVGELIKKHLTLFRKNVEGR
ncbi:MAG: hypothetical protein JW902_17065, partial [Syntrophaceae bacterium]|nr:hypothetical protein [Syntrophaceae bacterium]